MFTVSWFTRMTVRVPILGMMRIDLVMVLLLFLIHIMSTNDCRYKNNDIYKRLISLVVVIIIATPFAEWPGSAIKFGLENYIKSVMFFFFSVWYLKGTNKLQLYVLVFVICQSIRVIEPLYLHITEGYWGSMASMANWEYMNRLSGAPSDIINPNGLAFVVLTIIPFLLTFYGKNIVWRLLVIIVGPACLYALYLTGSRSGMLGLMVIVIIFIAESKNKIFYMFCAAMTVFIAVSSMEGDFKDRYLSIFTSNTKNSATAEGRIDGVYKDFMVGMRRPIFGHGLGTSREANSNYGRVNQLSHNIYTETFQEIGFIGVIMLILYMKTIVIKSRYISTNGASLYERKMGKILFVLSAMNIFFGLASYGLSSYEWYLIGGLIVAVTQINDQVGEDDLQDRII